MPEDHADIAAGLFAYPPFDLLPDDRRAALSRAVTLRQAEPGERLFEEGALLPGLFVVASGSVDAIGAGGAVVSRRGPGDMMGERGLLRDGRAVLATEVAEPSTLYLIPPDTFRGLVADVPAFAAWFEHAVPAEANDDGPYAVGLTALTVRDLMAARPVTCAPEATITEVARLMRDNRISSVVVMAGEGLQGIVTARDLTNKVLAEGLTGAVPVADVMTPNPVTIQPGALGLDALMALADHGISHLPVAEAGRIVGMIGKTDLFRRQAATASHMIAEIFEADTADAMAAVVARTPELLAQLVAAGASPQAICRRITDITDAVTRRLLSLAEADLGAPPVPYLWLACGSQGRREQTGVSDQDNCLILDDTARPEHDAYFAALARFVSEGLDTCGFVYCPGDMMATNPRWRQPRKTWRDYFARWIESPDKEAQMLASVMFDLRPIGGAFHLFDDLQAETLAQARANSIFVAHMTANAMGHSPPLSLFRGFALIRSGEHKNMLDLKHSGIVPVVDLARLYALKGALEPANTRDRIEAAGAAGVISASGAAELLDAYDLIAETRLRHQAAQIRQGAGPDNFMAPGTLSELERNHLRDAFLVVKTMQSAAGHGAALIG